MSKFTIPDDIFTIDEMTGEQLDQPAFTFAHYMIGTILSDDVFGRDEATTDLGAELVRQFRGVSAGQEVEVEYPAWGYVKQVAKRPSHGWRAGFARQLSPFTKAILASS
jgi:hypothetical protein